MLHIRQTDDTLTRVIGSGLSTAVPLLIGLLAGNMRIGTFGALGAFAFLSFQPFTPTKLAKRILKSGLAIMVGFLAGALSTFVPWMIPITISLVSLIGFRFYGLVLGSIIGFAGAALISFAMGMHEKELKLAHKYHKRQNS